MGQKLLKGRVELIQGDVGEAQRRAHSIGESGLVV